MSKKIGFTLIVVVIIYLLSAGKPLSAAHSMDAGDITAGDDVLISRPSSDRSKPAVTYNDDLDEYLAVWEDNRDSAEFGNIYGQILSSHGVPRGDNFVIRDEASCDLAFPDVAYDTNNQQYLVVWEDSTERDIEGQLLNQNGNLVGNPFNVLDGSDGDPASTPSVAFHPSTSTYFVAYRRGTLGDYNVEGKRVSADGTVAATEYDISSASGDQTAPDVSVNPATGGDFLVVWEDERTGVDRIYGALLYDTTWFLSAEFIISSNATEARRNPVAAFSPDADEWLVAFERDVDGDFQIVGRRVTSDGAVTGANFGICGDAQNQTGPTIAYNADRSQFLVAWRDTRGATPPDIYGRRVASAGGPTGDVFAINTAMGSQFDLAVAAAPTALGYLVLFTNVAPTGAEDIVGQRVNTSGAPEGDALTVSTPVGNQKQPAMAYNSMDEEYLVVWHDQRDGDLNIYGQRVDLDGSVLGPNFAICNKANTQLLPDVAYNLDTNQYLVVWEDRRSDADIYGQRVDADGSLEGDELPIAGVGATARRRPKVTFNAISGEYLVVYVYATDNGNIRGRRVPATGGPITGEFDIATGTTEQNYPDVASRNHEQAGGGYLVVWRDTADAQRDIRGQRLTQTGALLDTPLDICVEASSQWSPGVAYHPDNDRYLVVWPDDRDDATQGRNIYGRQVGGGGALYDAFAISTAEDDQAPVAVTYASGPASYVVAWEDTRNGNADLYGQRIGGTGALEATQADTNTLLFTGTGEQASPALAWSGEETQGLLAWEDGRNGASYHIYGLQMNAAPISQDDDVYLYLPLLIREAS